MQTNSISRRRFAHLLGVGAAAAVVRPSLARGKSSPGAPTSSAVLLDSNENPFGPAPGALEAIRNSFDLACRYPDETEGKLVAALAQSHGVGPEQILLGAGSGEILKICATAFEGPVVVADPTFEAIARHAEQRGLRVVRAPLTDTYAHDLPKMAAAAKGGLLYLCNPNNPTASITPKKAVRDSIAGVPLETTILVDEAYHHFVESDDYESVIPLVQEHPNLIVARTFSKIYGMAGLRCGYAIGRPETITRMRPQRLSHSVNVLALVAASASLEDKELVSAGRSRNSEIRAFVTKELEVAGYRSIPSHGNFIMVDLKRPVTPLIAAMKQRNVRIGRLFPALPNHMRLTIGEKAEMETFLAAFREAMA